MPDDSKKIFVTYRRALSTDFVHRLRDHLKARDFDVFVDVQSIPSGKFAAAILHQIEARPHFLAILVPGSLQRTTSEDDWYRREIEHALKTRRNIIPLLAKGFSFAEEHQKLRRKTLPGRLDQLKQYQHLSFIYEYDEQFQANIDVLVKRFLVIPEETRVVPTPKTERRTVQQLSALADVAKANPAGTDWILPLQRRFLFTSLPAPTLALPVSGRFAWTAVADAADYVLQVSRDEAFSKPDDLYTGKKAEFVQPPQLLGLSPLALAGLTNPLLATDPLGTGLLSGRLFGARYYRVKARAGLGRLDSPWSNIVKVEPPKPLPLPAPTLEEPSFHLLGRKFTWTAIEGAVGYLLQTARDQAFSQPKDLYTGEKTDFVESLGRSPLTALALAGVGLVDTPYYRVKARAGPGRLDSPWSNIVKVEPPKPLPAPRLEPPAPQLVGRKLSWTAVSGAAGYLLQTSQDEAFSKPEDLYEGPNSEFVEGRGSSIGSSVPLRMTNLSQLLAALDTRYYRVRATALPGSADSPWSNIVKY